MDQRILADLFSTSALPKKKIKSAVQRFNGATVLSPRFWERLQQDPEFSAGNVDELRFTSELGELTGYHLPLVRELQRRRKRGTIRHVADLLTLDWDAVLTQRAGSKAIGAPSDTPGKSKTQLTKNYARALSAKAAALFPTASIARGIKDENHSANQALVRFFDENPAFDFRTASIDAYLSDTPDALAGIAADETEDLVRQLKRLQRLFGLTDGDPNQYTAMRKLIDDGLDSAQAIASMEEEAFCNKYPENLGIIKNPRAVHAKASHRAATAMALFAKYSRHYNSVEVAAIGQSNPASGAQNAVDQAPAPAANGGTPAQGKNSGNGGSGNDGSGNHGTKIPDWEKLFGSLNRCQCEHCRSVLSPSAYLVDLLALLKDLELKRPESETTALEVLLERRPDISEIELSCANADKTLPYVDLVNEVLENAVFPLKFSITEDADNLIEVLKKGQVTETLIREFTENERPLSNDAKANALSDGVTWGIIDGSKTYRIKTVVINDKNQLEVTVKPPSVQTNGTAADLGANPEHLNVEVYDALKEKIYPWAVPFDLWAEEARAYLEHLGVPRHRLMELFLTGKEKKISVATEYFGLTQKEKQLLTDAEPMEPWQVWGEDERGTGGHSWIDALKPVPVFLERSGLSYDQLTDLLETRYINFEKKIQIDFADLGSPEERITTSPCDYTKATIEWPKDVLYKAHCFLRLQRKTGWTIREFDKVLKALGYAGSKSFDAPLLVGLRHVHELQNGLRIPIEELLSWFAPIDTDPGVDGGPSLYDQLFLNRSVQRSTGNDFALKVDRTVLVEKDGLAVDGSDNKPVICGALEIGAQDFDRLTAEMFPDEKERQLTLDNLSSLHRAASLARALRLSIKDFLSLRAIMGIDPIDPATGMAEHAEAVVHFVAQARMVTGAGFSVEDA